MYASKGPGNTGNNEPIIAMRQSMLQRIINAISIPKKNLEFKF